MAIWNRERKGVLGIVIYLKPNSTVKTPWSVPGPFGPTVTVNYKEIKLWEESVADWLATSAPGLMPFVPMLQGATLETLTPAIACLEATVPDLALRGTLLNYLASFATQIFGSDLVAEYFRRNPMLDQFIMESPWYRSILERGTLMGEERGRTVGREEGREEGEILGLRQSLHHYLRRRFAAISDQAESLIATIQQKDILNTLFDRLFDATSDEEALLLIQQMSQSDTSAS